MTLWSELLSAQGPIDLGQTRWTSVTQDRIDTFAHATGDFQFIHVDPERAARDGPFGGTIVHGYLLLSMLPVLLLERMAFPPEAVLVNYGLEKVRFVTPIKVGERFRGRFILTSRNWFEPTKLIVKVRASIDVETSPRPALEADPLIALVRLPAGHGVAPPCEPADGPQ